MLENKNKQNNTPATIGQRIKALRMKKGVSQKVMAELLHTDKSVICHWEKDDRHPSEDMVKKLAKYFEVTPEYLIYGPRKALESEDLLDLSGLNLYQRYLIREIVKEFSPK